jgi:anti-anti-sigma factor
MSDQAPALVRDEVSTRTLTVPADEGQLALVRDFITEVCEQAGFSRRETNNTKLAVDEACTNIIKHAYDDNAGDIELRADITSGDVTIHILDSGKRFDFAGVKDPDLDQYVETGKKGGLGVFLINRLMDRVEYRSGHDGNELVLARRSQAATARVKPGHIGWRGSLRYKFTLRASLGFFVLIAAIGAYIYFRQSSTLQEQHATQWMEKRRLAENLSNKSKELLLNPRAYSVEQTTLTAFVSQMLEGNRDLAYARVVDRDGTILSSGQIDEIFTEYSPVRGEILLREENGITWKRLSLGDESVRNIEYPVRVRNQGNGETPTVGSVHLGIYEGKVSGQVRDPRLFTSLLIFGIFIVGVFLIVGLVNVFVKPIQVLTDGVRAIGQGSLDGKISTEGPAEIGAIAAVFNEISEKFKRAQESVLEQEKLQKEIEVAKQIQQALLPKRHPAVSGYDIAPYYQAAKEVGGDYYDFVEVDEETLGVVVADVSGKGVPGSLVMTMIRTALRMEARGNKNASDVMAKMNDFVTDDMKKGMFVTMFYVILDSKNRIISYASAGHNPMILYRANTQDIFFLNPKGFPVGIALPDETLFRRSISLEKIKLKRDDMLLIYTDGVTEAMNEKREQYGEERLTELVKENGQLPPTEFIDVLEKDIKAFTRGNAQNDDITVVAVKEKLAADDVLYGIRKKLMDMVDVAGMSVKEACANMKVSPSTYYRYKKRMTLMGDRGLKNKVLREDLDFKRVSIQERKELIKIIREHPEYGAKRLAEEYNKIEAAPRAMTEKMIYEELRRLTLNTKELRLDYLRRHHLLDEMPETKTSREMIEELINEVARKAAADETTADEAAAKEGVAEDAVAGETGEDRALVEALQSDKEMVGPVPDGSQIESAEGVRIDASESKDGVAILEVDGHLDSISSTALEKALQDVIAGGHAKIVIDLSDVSYISSGGWGVMVGTVDKSQRQDGDVVVVGMASEVYDVYELLGFNELLKSFATTEDALTYLGQPVEARRSREEPVVSVSETIDDPGPPRDEFAAPSEGGAEWESLQIEAVTVGEKGDIAVISLRGIIDTISAERLRGAIDRVIRSGINKIVIDMSSIEYVSSGGWGTFTERLREVRRLGGDIKLFGMDADVYYIFTMLGFNIVLSSFDILSDAIEDFARGTEDKPSLHPGRSTEPVAETEAIAQDVDTEVADEVETSDLFDRVSRDGMLTSTNRVEWETSGDGLIARIHGMIESSTVDEIDAEIENKLGARPPLVIFAIGDVDYVSSIGWGIFPKYYERVSGWEGKIALCDMNNDLQGIFGCLEFRSFIPAFATLEDALSSSGVAHDSAAAIDGQEAPRSEAVTGTNDGPGEPELLDLDDLMEPGEKAPREVTDAEVETSGGGAWAEESAEISEEDIAPLMEPLGGDGPKAPEDEFVDFDRSPTDVSIERGVRDEHVTEDSKLRKMGWEEYGKRLKDRTGKKGGKQADEDDS